MNKLLKETKKHFEKSYFDEHKKKRIKAGVWEGIKQGPKRKRKKPLIKYYGAAAILLIGMVTGSAFISPTISNALSNITVLNMIFKQDTPTPVIGAIEENLHQSDYKIGKVSLHVREKIYSVGLTGSDNYYSKVKDDVKNHVQDILESKGLSAYTAEIYHESKDNKIDMKPKSESLTQEENAIRKELLNMDYKIDKATYITNENTFSIGVEGDSQYLRNIEQELKRDASKLLSSYGKEGYEVEIFREIDGTTTEMFTNKGWATFKSDRRQGLITKSLILESLIKEGYMIDRLAVIFNGSKYRVQVAIPKSERSREEIKNHIRNQMESMDKPIYSVKLQVLDHDALQAQARWRPVLHSLTVGLTGQENLQVESVGFEFTENPYLISVKTSIDSTTENGQVSKAIKSEIDQFMSSKKVKDVIKDDAFKVQIISENGKLIKK